MIQVWISPTLELEHEVSILRKRWLGYPVVTSTFILWKYSVFCGVKHSVPSCNSTPTNFFVICIRYMLTEVCTIHISSIFCFDVEINQIIADIVGLIHDIKYVMVRVGKGNFFILSSNDNILTYIVSNILCQLIDKF